MKNNSRDKNERRSAYYALADWFEYLNDDCGYEEWSQYLINALKSRVKDFASGADVGCGSGYFTRALKKAGYDVIGVDISDEMLVKAQQLSQRETLSIPYIRQDISSLKLIKKVDFITAVNDCINYVPKNKLSAAMKSVYASLNRGGYFLFDISGENKLRNKEKGVSADDRDDVTYISFNDVDGDRVLMDVTVFVRENDNLFKRFDERHLLYIYSIPEIEAALTGAGFKIECESGHLGEDKAISDRIEFIAIKP